MQHNDAGTANDPQQPNAVPSPNAGQYAPYDPSEIPQASQMPIPGYPQDAQHGYPHAYPQQPAPYTPVQEVPRKPNRVMTYITAGFVILISALVIVAGISMFSQEVEINYPQADNCGSILQPASLNDDGDFAIGMRESACKQALSSKTGEAFMPIGIGLALIGFMAWLVFNVNRQYQKWRAQYGRR